MWVRLAFTILLLSACAPLPDTTTASLTTPPLSPQILLDGCAELRVEPDANVEPAARLICALKPEGILTAWLDVREDVSLSVSGGVLEERRQILSGTRARLRVTEGASALSIQLHQRHPLGDLRGHWALHLVTPDPPRPAVAESDALKKAGKLAEARRVLQRALSQASSERDERRARSALARVHIASGDHRTAIEMLSVLKKEYLAAGEISQAIKEEVTENFLRLDDANTYPEIETAEAEAYSIAEQAIFQHYLTGFHHYKKGRMRSASHALSRSIEIAHLVDQPSLTLYSRAINQQVYNALGKYEAGISEIRAHIETPTDNPCLSAAAHTNQVWLMVNWLKSARDVSPPADLLASTSRSIEVALRLYEHDCREKNANFDLLINSALFHFFTGSRPDAATYMTRLKEMLDADEQTPARIKAWYQILRALFLQQEGDDRRAVEEARFALSTYGEQIEPEIHWELQTLLGKSLITMKAYDAAISALLKAEGTKNRILAEIKLKQGAETFVGKYNESARLLYQAYYHSGQHALLFDHFRRVRASFIRHITPITRDRPARTSEMLNALDEALARLQQALRLSTAEERRSLHAKIASLRAERDELLDQQMLGEDRETALPPRPHLTVAFIEVNEGWLVLSYMDGEISARLLQPPAAITEDVQRLGQRLLAPLEDALQRSQRISVLPYGDSKRIDFHALQHPRTQAPLIDTHEISYALDISGRPPLGGEAGAREALIIQNPSGNLRGADREGEHVDSALSGARWSTRVYTRQAATKGNLLGAMAGKALLHYAGHGKFTDTGWDSHLPLLGEDRLTAQDILTAGATTPTRVILSGCETGRSTLDSPVETLSIAHAFLLAGSEEVIAAVRPVDDTHTFSFMQILYAHFTDSGDLSAAYQAALRGLRRRHPDADWAAFRLFTR